MAIILDGISLADGIRSKVATRVASLPTQPGLAVILVGSDPASHTYVGLKQKACEEAGIAFEKFEYNESVPEKQLIQKVQELNAREDITGILVQLPLPNQDANNIIPQIDPKKDVDGFHRTNVENLRAGKPAIASAVALGIMKLIRAVYPENPLPQEAKNATIVSSPLFAEPLQILLKEQDINVTVTQAEDPNLIEKTKNAGIVIVAEGEPGLIKGDMISPGATVIDVGTTKINGKLHGDVEMKTVQSIAKAVSPVPGGVGPMTVAMLLVNILKAYQLQRVDK